MKIALLDGFNLAFRAFYGMPDLAREDGFPTGALHGWVRSLWWIEDHLQPDHMLVFFDLGGAARQLALHQDYKANRSEAPEALRQQIPVIKQWTRLAGYQGIEVEGVEADDLLAVYAHHFAARGDTVMVVSADKDLAQLVGGNVCQWLPPPTANPRMGWRCLDAAGVEDKFGVRPAQIADYLALIGDTADNIPGLAGVGPKTAAKWLVQFGDLEQIIAHCGELQPKRFQQQVHQQADLLRRNRCLTRLDAAAAVPADLPDVPADLPRAAQLLRDMGMLSSADKLLQRAANAVQRKP